MKVRRAVILTAGYGTRLLPATKAQPKAILPIVDKPTIQYAVEEAVASGLDEVVIVMSPGQQVIEDHFSRSRDLEKALETKGNEAQAAMLRCISELADISYVQQREPRGIGDAVLTARQVVGNEPFVLFFPDDVIVAEKPVAKQLVETFQARGGSVLAVEEVPQAEIESYGIVAGDPLGHGVYQLQGVVEKPKAEDAPSNLGIVGRYVLTPEIFDVITETPPGKGGEIQITDAIGLLLERQPVFALQFEGRRYDIGRPLGLIKASVELALERDDIGPDLREYLRGLELD